MKRRGVFVLICASSAFAQTAPVNCPSPDPGEARPWMNPRYSAPCRARYALGQLKTMDDKFAFLESSGGGGGRGRSNQRDVMAELGLMRGGGSDGPAGVRGRPGVTAFPTPLSVAANFDPAMATRYGDLLGQEFFAAGLNTVLGPAMDITRTWHFGRSTESFGEDPFLTASTVGPEIAALQEHHVIATMKHYAAYTQEQGRVGDSPVGSRPAVNEQISERALREIYLPGFHAAVTRGGAGAVMCSFPRVNGIYACENPYTLGVLKKEWGFDGYVGPDFPDAQRSIVPAFLAGLDTGVIAPPPAGGRGSSFTGQKSLRQAVSDGEVPASRVDDIILRRLTPGFRIGVFDHPAKAPSGEVSTPERRAAAIDVITGGAVLLKNTNNVLPLGPAVKSVAIIGTQATEKAVVVEQGSPYVKAVHLAPVLAAIKERAGQKVRVTFAPGTLGISALPAVPAAMWKTPSGDAGVRAEYFPSPTMDFKGKPVAVRTEKTMTIDKKPDIEGLPANLQWSVRYTGMFTPDRAGIHRFTLAGSGEARLFVANKEVAEFMRADFSDTTYANLQLAAGAPVEIRLEYTPREALGDSKRDMFDIPVGLYVSLGWAPPDNLIAQAAEAARTSDVAIVFVGQQLGEGMDRMRLTLPGDQDALIETVAKANPRTVVVLNTGGGVTMPWLNNVAGLLEMWLPGDSYGPAAARLLFGDADPGGRLPVTFAADETQGPATKPAQYPGLLSDDGSLDTAHFDEGIFIGYRYWDQHNEKPLFPFGYGLSYTTFTMKAASVKATRDGGAMVNVAVRNTGRRAGSEVVQVYLGFPAAAGEPPKQLKAFEKVTLQQGAAKTVHLTLDPDAFQYWDEGKHAWKTAPGAYRVMVGRSSRDIASALTVTPTTH